MDKHVTRRIISVKSCERYFLSHFRTVHLLVISPVPRTKISIMSCDRDYMRAQRNDAAQRLDWRRLPPRAIRLSHLHIMLTFSNVSSCIRRGGRARDCYPRTVRCGRAFVRRNFLGYEAGLLKRITGCGILIIPFTWYPRSFYTAPFARA